MSRLVRSLVGIHVRIPEPLAQASDDVSYSVPLVTAQREQVPGMDAASGRAVGEGLGAVSAGDAATSTGGRGAEGLSLGGGLAVGKDEPCPKCRAYLNFCKFAHVSEHDVDRAIEFAANIAMEVQVDRTKDMCEFHQFWDTVTPDDIVDRDVHAYMCGPFLDNRSPTPN